MTRVVIVGAGFAGFNAARVLPGGCPAAAEVVLVNPTDYFLYLPLLPEVAAGILDPRRVDGVARGRAARGAPGARRRCDAVDLDGRSRRLRRPGGRRGGWRTTGSC